MEMPLWVLGLVVVFMLYEVVRKARETVQALPALRRKRWIVQAYCNGQQNAWICYAGDWDALLPSMAARVSSGAICPVCAAALVLQMASDEGRSETERADLVQRMLGMVSEKEDQPQMKHG